MFLYLVGFFILIIRNQYCKEKLQIIYTDLYLQSIDISYSIPELSPIWIIAVES